MKIVVAAGDRQWEELTGTNAEIEWIRVAGGNAFTRNTTADAFIDLKESIVLSDYAGLEKPVLINAVTTTLTAMDAPENVIRINGWPGFLQRPVWEVAGTIDDTAKALFEKLSKKITVVADQPGLVAARIISMIINEAYFTVADKVSSKEEIDTAMKLGTNYPFGPFEWAAAIDPANVLELLQQLNITDKRYRPAPLLLEEVTGDHS